MILLMFLLIIIIIIIMCFFFLLFFFLLRRPILLLNCASLNRTWLASDIDGELTVAVESPSPFSSRCRSTSTSALLVQSDYSLNRLKHVLRADLETAGAAATAAISAHEHAAMHLRDGVDYQA